MKLKGLAEVRRPFLLLYIAFAVCVPYVFSASLEELVDPTHIVQLRSGASVSETQLKNPVLKLLPRHEELRQFVTGAISSLNPSLAVETLFLYKKPVSTNSWSYTQRTDLFNQTLAISTLTGIQYFSASRNTMRTFYESSGVIDGPQTKKPLPDPFYIQPPESLTIYTRQKDLTFGDNIYRYDFKLVRDAMFFIQENETVLSYGIIQAIGKNRLRSAFAVIDCGDSLLIYAVSMARAAALPGMGDRISDSFGNRAEAVLKWFTGKADRVF